MYMYVYIEGYLRSVLPARDTGNRRDSRVKIPVFLPPFTQGNLDRAERAGSVIATSLRYVMAARYFTALAGRARERTYAISQG
jgi:hypothetical protein